MTLKEYRKIYNMAPLTLTEFAAGALEVANSSELADAAEAYLRAEELFISQLEKLGIEIG